MKAENRIIGGCGLYGWLPEVGAIAHSENIGSRRVLEKVGFEFVRFVPDMERFLDRRGRHGKQVAE
jgi:hypothetical protein